MSGRGFTDYTVARAERRETMPGFDPDTPVMGFYKMRLRSGARFVGVRIWFGAPLDPVTGEEMDRSHRWQAQAEGAYIDLEQVWPKCAADRITEQEYAYLLSLGDWSQQHAPSVADPFKRVDPLSSPILF